MKNHLIPLNNDLKKLVAFIPSLEKNWRDNQRIDSKPFQIESLSTIEKLKDEGWNIQGGMEIRGKNRKVTSHQIRMTHEDFKMQLKGKKDEAVSTLTLNNSCNGSKPLEMDLGTYRQVCSNGMIAFDRYANFKVKHNESGLLSLDSILKDLGISTQRIMGEFLKLKDIEISSKQALQIANEAMDLRFGQEHNVNAIQLLNIHRPEDKGNDLWTVYNRIQENITQPNMIVNGNGIKLGGVSGYQDTVLNKQLFKLIQDHVKQLN